jgi:hypothetical protein
MREEDEKAVSLHRVHLAAEMIQEKARRTSL